MVARPTAPVKTLGSACLTSWHGYSTGVTQHNNYPIHQSPDNTYMYFLDDFLNVRMIGQGEWVLEFDENLDLMLRETLPNEVPQNNPTKKEQLTMSKTPPAQLKPQVDPITKPESVNVVPEVMKDLTDRLAMGIKTYGVPLQTHNGRDALQDTYEELLDAACYIKQLMMEKQL